MAFNGSGTFTVDTVGTPFVYDTVIDFLTVNNVLAELEQALSLTVCKDGQTTLTGDLSMSGFRLTNLGSPIHRLDAPTVESSLNRTFSYNGSVGGTANAITVSLLAAPASYVAGMRFTFVAGSTNTGAVTINVSALGVKNVMKPFAVALTAGDIIAGQIVDVQYDGTQFIIMSPLYAEGSWTPSVGGTATYTNQIGRWTKNGRLMHVTGLLTINTIGTGSTSVISGLPLSAANLSADQAVGVSDFASLATNVVWMGARVNTNAATVTLRSLTAAGASAASNAVLGNGSSVTFGGTYII